MKCVKTQKDIMHNIKVINRYLDQKKEPFYSFALDLVKNGICFIAVKEGENSYRFYPSRFMGYRRNNRDAHLNNTMKDGKETNPAISAILGSKPIPNPTLESYYKAYCEHLGFSPRKSTPFGSSRKFWEWKE